MPNFKKLGLSSEVTKVLKELGFEKPSEIQEQAIPNLITKNTDFIGLAQTGTGKTAAFGLPLLERIDSSNPSTQALVLAPTRELGQQIAAHLYQYSKYLDKINVLAVYGGAAIHNQIKSLKKPQHIIIATPGRLIDLIKRKAIKLDKLQFLVLDEADEMLNMGFKEEIDEILAYTPDDKLTWLFSATMPPEIKKIVKKYMDQPLEVRVNSKNEVNANIEHLYAVVRQKDKTDALMRFLDIQPDLRGVVFCRTKRDTRDLADVLLKKKYRADALHGDLTQGQRDRVMRRFKAHELQVLIATDVAARGIDVNDLTHVFHFTLPDQLAYYTHRSGRTARAGKSGTSIAFISGREERKIRQIEKQLSISFQQAIIPNAENIADITVEKWCKRILETSSKNKIDPAIIDKANILFGNLSKEELTAKILIHELAKLNVDSDKDLNDTFRKDVFGSGERRDGGYKGRKKVFHKKGGHRDRFKSRGKKDNARYKKRK